MIGDTVQIDNKELIEWIDGIPFSRPARNLTRDFSDAGKFADFNVKNDFPVFKDKFKSNCN